jgi:hypothetical protein
MQDEKKSLAEPDDFLAVKRTTFGADFGSVPLN